MVVMSDDLVAFLRARLSEDEEVARTAAGRYLAAREWLLIDSGSTPGLIGDGKGDVVRYGFGSGDIPIRDQTIHIVRHDPARVLREVEAKRRILDGIVTLIDRMDSAIESEWGSGFGSTGESDKLLTLLALPYADHPGYRQEWKP